MYSDRPDSGYILLVILWASQYWEGRSWLVISKCPSIIYTPQGRVHVPVLGLHPLSQRDNELDKEIDEGFGDVREEDTAAPPSLMTDITIDDPVSEGDDYQKNTEEEEKVKSHIPNGHHKQMPNNTVCVITTLRLRKILLQLIQGEFPVGRR